MGDLQHNPRRQVREREIPPPSCKTIMYLEFLGSPRGSGFGVLGFGGGGACYAQMVKLPPVVCPSHYGRFFFSALLVMMVPLPLRGLPNPQCWITLSLILLLRLLRSPGVHPQPSAWGKLPLLDFFSRGLLPAVPLAPALPRGADFQITVCEFVEINPVHFLFCV